MFVKSFQNLIGILTTVGPETSYKWSYGPLKTGLESMGKWGEINAAHLKSYESGEHLQNQIWNQSFKRNPRDSTTLTGFSQLMTLSFAGEIYLYIFSKQTVVLNTTTHYLDLRLFDAWKMLTICSQMVA